MTGSATTGAGPEPLTRRRVAGMIDHALLRPELTEDDVRAGCALARRYEVISVCVRPVDVPLAAELLADTGVLVGTVIGFPHGAHATEVKVAETGLAVARGAAEVDMVLPIGALRAGDLDGVGADIAAVVRAAGPAPVKVILENAYLDDEQKVAGCRVAERAGAAFVKTSTGFAGGGATVADVRLMRASVSPHIGVKASGGVRTLAQLRELAAAGATRFGSSSTAAILDQLDARPAPPGDPDARPGGPDHDG